MKIIAIAIIGRGLRYGFRKTFEDHSTNEMLFLKDDDAKEDIIKQAKEVIETDNPTVYVDERLDFAVRALGKTRNYIGADYATLEHPHPFKHIRC